MKSYFIIFNKLSTSIFFLFLFGLTTHTHANIQKNQTPFNTKEIGSKYMLEANVISPNIYAIRLDFYKYKPNKFFYIFDKKPSPQESKEINNILGISYTNNKIKDFGIPIKIRAKIIEKNNKKLIVDRIIIEPESNSTSYGRYTVLVKSQLDRGSYITHIEYLEGSSTLSNLQAKLSFISAYSAK